MFIRSVFLTLFLIGSLQQAQAFNFMPSERMSSVFISSPSGVQTMITTRESILKELGLKPNDTTTEDVGNKIFDREEAIAKKNKEANKK